MEEQEAVPGRPPGRRKQYSEPHKQKILEAFATRKGSVEEFCQEHEVGYSTLMAWKRGRGKAKTRKAEPKRRSPEQRRQAVEAFAKSGQSLVAFGKAWGVNPQVLGRWVRTYREKGPKALGGRLGRKPGRKPVPSALREGIREVKTQFPDFGLRKVQGFLARFRGLKVSPPVIRRVVQEEALPPGHSAAPRWKKKPVVRRFERSRPGELWQTDITSFVLPRHGQRVYLVAFMDDFSRYIVSWKLGMKQTAEFVQEALLEGIQRFGKPQELLSDQGRQYFTWRGKSSFQVLLERQGIRHVISRTHHPETLGKCERFWKTVGEEFWSRARPMELHDAQARLGAFINHYNHFRPHQGLDNAVPADRFFGATNAVRLALEAAWKENQLALAVEEPTRQPVFLVGQIGEQSVSLHGERGKLILQTSEGVRQELAAHDLGMAQVFPSSKETPNGTDLDGNGPGRDDGTPAGGPQTPKKGGETQVGLPDGHTAVPGAGDLGAGDGRGTPGSPQDGCADAGALAGADDPQGPGEQAQPAAVAGVAVEPAGAGRDGGGLDGPAEAAAQGDADGKAGEEREGGNQGAPEEGEHPGAGEPCAEGAAGPAEGHAGAGDSGDPAEGEKNQDCETGESSARESGPGCGVQTEGRVTGESQPPSWA